MQQDLKIPANYFELAKKYQGFFGEAKVDQFWLELDTSLNIVYDNEAKIRQESSELHEHFPAEDADEDEEFVNKYDLGYITDFSQVLTFGMDGAGCQFCMDFSQNREKPRIIFWDDRDLRWRIIADSLEEFFALFTEDSRWWKILDHVTF